MKYGLDPNDNASGQRCSCCEHDKSNTPNDQHPAFTTPPKPPQVAKPKIFSGEQCPSSSRYRDGLERYPKAHPSGGRETLQRSGRWPNRSAFQAGDHRLGGVHAFRELRLGQAGPRPGFDQSRGQGELRFQGIIGFLVAGTIQPRRCWSSRDVQVIEPSSPGQGPMRSHGVASSGPS